MEVIQHDFGKEKNEAVARFARLMGYVESQHAEILADPVKFFNIASREIARLRLLLRDMKEASMPHTTLEQFTPRAVFDDTVRMPKSQYDCLMAVKRLLDNELPY